MDIRDLIDEFVSRRRYKPYESICEDVLTSGKSYSLCSQEVCTESEYLQINIRSSVRGYTRNKDNAVELYKAFVSFLRERDVDAEVEFPPVAISSAFDRRIFIAKYLQSEGARLDELENILWVSARTINEDLCSLREESAANGALAGAWGDDHTAAGMDILRRNGIM